MNWRNEYKYYISDSDAILLKHRLSSMFEIDKNAVAGGYLVRSLYFDDPYKSGVFNKLDGVKNRVRYRIRKYNDESKFKLEAKLRSNQMISKTSQWINMEEYHLVMSNQLDVGNVCSGDVFQAFFLNMKKYHLRPSVIVEYDRVPFVVKGTDVRITIDMNVRSYKSCVNLVNPEVAAVPVFMYPRQQILEVKFTDKIPSYVTGVLQSIPAQRYAISKYALCSRYIRNNVWEDN